MVIPYALFVLFMAANSQYPPWGQPNPYVYPEYYSAPAYEIFPPGQLAFGKAEHHKVHHKMHVHK